MSTFADRRAILRAPWSSNAKCVAMLIADLQRLEGGACTMSVESIGDACGFSRATAKRAIRELRGCLTETRQKGRPTTRILDLTRVNSDPGPGSPETHPQTGEGGQICTRGWVSPDPGGGSALTHKKREIEERDRGSIPAAPSAETPTGSATRRAFRAAVDDGLFVWIGSGHSPGIGDADDVLGLVSERDGADLDATATAWVREWAADPKTRSHTPRSFALWAQARANGRQGWTDGRRKSGRMEPCVIDPEHARRTQEAAFALFDSLPAKELAHG